MTTKQITAPAALPVSLDEAKLSLRIDGDELDGDVTRWIKGIVATAEHETGRAFIHQTWRCTLDEFPDAIRLDHAPLVSVESIRFYDVAGVLQTLDPQDYLVDTITEPGYVVPASGRAWPATADRINSLMVDYTAGYGATEVSVPENVKLYIIARLVEQYDPDTRMLRDSVQSEFVGRLLDAVKVYG